jgi:hypothetical protein
VYKPDFDNLGMQPLKQISDFLKVDAKGEARFWDTPDDDAGQSVPALP